MLSADSMQQAEQDSPQSVSPVALKFPTIAVHGTPASWLSQSQLITMSSKHDDNSCDDTSSSLGDSSYDFVDDRSIATTDDEDQEAMTESITSSDEHGLDYPHPRQLHARSNVTDDHNSHSQGSNDYSNQNTLVESDPYFSDQEADLPALPEQIPLSKLYEQHEAIEFVEPSITNLNFSRPLEVSHTLKITDARDSPVSNYHLNMLEPRSGNVAVTVRQTMACGGLQLRGRPYKVLYVGIPSMRDAILQKIATALATSLRNSSFPDSEKPRASKFNVVPISAFGDEASPEVVLIDSSGLEMNVEECSFASFTRKEDGNDSIRMQLSDGTEVISSWSRSKFILSNDWRTPDIAIIGSSGRDGAATKQTRRIFRSFMSRHAVQTIVVTESPHWDFQADPITLDYMTPHIHLESLEPMGQTRSRTVGRLPIDLATFLSIDAGQMNRNLACLDSARGSPKDCMLPKFTKSRISSQDRLSFQEIYDACITDFRKDGLKCLNRYEYMAGFVMMLMSVLGIVVVGLGLTGVLGASRVTNSRVVSTNVISNSAPSFSTSTSMSAAPLTLLSRTGLAEGFVPSVPTAVSPGRSLSTDVDIASFLLDAYTLSPIKSEQFKVHVLGDCHVVLRPPHWFGKMKKAPKLLFKITRGDKTLDHQLSALFDGVYALQIPRENAYGVLNVAIWTESKPKINESFEVDFGSSWFKVVGWKKASRVLTESIRSDMDSIQTSLRNLYSHTMTRLSDSLQEQGEVKKAMLNFHLEALSKAKELVMLQTKDLLRRVLIDLHQSHAAASNTIKRHSENITKDLIAYGREKTFTITQQSRILAQEVTISNLRAFRSVRVFSQKHLRDTQKRALRMWWKIGGAPKKTLKVKNAGKGPSPNGSSSKQRIRHDEL